MSVSPAFHLQPRETGMLPGSADIGIECATFLVFSEVSCGDCVQGPGGENSQTRADNPILVC